MSKISPTATLREREDRTISDFPVVCQLEDPLAAGRALVSTRCTSEMAQASTIGFRLERSLSRAPARVGSRDTSSARLRAPARRPVPRSLGGEKRGNAVRISASAGASESSPFRMIVLRHSDSCTQDADLRDHDRPLTSWGRTAAAKLCSELVAKGWAEPDLVLCSASTRSRRPSARWSERTRPSVRLRPTSWGPSTPSPRWTA